MSKFYITTAIAYVNAAPHIGFAMELIQADVLARYHRMIGDDVYFLTGTDEHGVKIVQTAKEQGLTAAEMADKNSAKNRELVQFLNISADQFIRTSSPEHKAGAQKLWSAIAAADGFYKKTYEGLYCVGCEAYVTEKDLVDGNCPTHKKPPQFFQEENYFFKYSEYLPEVKKRIESGEIKIIPESRKTEMLNLIAEGMDEKRDISFSRPSKTLSWGVPVPGDDSQTMYVWCDALSNYITALDYEHEGELFKSFWPADAHVIGKDILRFHAGFWPAMLLAAKLPLPKAIFVHGYVTSEGQKMSKSIGNVVDPFDAGAKHGVDALRFFLMREIPTTDDGDFSEARFDAVYASELANNLGNLLSRVVTMAEKYNGGKVPEISKDENFETKVLETWKMYQAAVNDFNLRGAIEAALGLLTFANQYIDETRPWELAKKEPAEVLKILYHLLELLRHAGFMFLPFMPATAEKIFESLKCESRLLYPDAIAWGGLKEGTPLKKVGSLFPKEA